MKASEFKASALAVMRRVHGTGEAVIVTSHGKPLVRVEAVRGASVSGYGCMADRGELVASDEEIVNFSSGEWATLDRWDAAMPKKKKGRPRRSR